MRSKRSKRWDENVKARLLTTLMYYDPDYKFEYAVRGLHAMLATYTQKQLIERLNQLGVTR